MSERLVTKLSPWSVAETEPVHSRLSGAAEAGCAAPTASS